MLRFDCTNAVEAYGLTNATAMRLLFEEGPQAAIDFIHRNRLEINMERQQREEDN